MQSLVHVFQEPDQLIFIGKFDMAHTITKTKKIRYNTDSNRCIELSNFQLAM